MSLKKLFKFIFKTILILLLVLIISVVVLAVALYDSTDVTNYEVIDKNKPTQLVFNNALYDGTYDVKNTKEAQVLFSEEELEALLYPIVMSLNQDGLIYEITGVDIDVIEGEYYFETSITIANFFKSVATANLKILNENDSFVITLKNLKLGSISITKIGNYLVKNIDSQELENTLSKKDIYVDLNLKDFTITCSYNDIDKMIEAKVTDKQSSLIRLLFDVFLTNKKFMDMSLGNDDLLGLYAHLGTAEFDESLEGELHYDYSFDAIASNVKELLDKDLITYKDVNLVFNYLVRGYDSLEEKDKELIDNVNLGTLIENKAEYKGIIKKPDVSLMGYMNELFTNKTGQELSLILENGIQFSDKFLKSLLQSFNYMGYSYAYSNEENNVGYFVLEQLNFACKDQFVDIHLVMNFNGLRLYLESSFDCLDDNSKGLKINGAINDLNIGDYHLTESQKELLIAYLSDLLNSLDWISIDENSQEICLDFSQAMLKIVSGNSILNLLIGNSINNVTDTYIVEGEVSIVFDLNNRFLG